MRYELALLAMILTAPRWLVAWLVGTKTARPCGAESLAQDLLAIAGLLVLYPALRRGWGRGIAAATLVLVVYGTQVLAVPQGPVGWVRLTALCLGCWATWLWWEQPAQEQRPWLAPLGFGALVGAMASLNLAALGLLGLVVARPWARGETWPARARPYVGTIVGVVGGIGLGVALHGAVRAGAPLLEQGLYDLWGPQHGLIYWSPLLWLALVAPILRVRREPRWAWAHAAAWLGALGAASFRRGLGRGEAVDLGFEALLGTLVLGLAAACSALVESTRRRPGLTAIAVAGAVVGWNLLFMEQYTRYMIPRDDTVGFARVAGNSARLVVAGLGAPNAWPAVWWFGARSGVALERYDALFADPVWHGSSARLELGEPHADGAWVMEGWDSGRQREDAWCRPIRSAGRLLLPIPSDVPHGDVAVRVRAHGHGTLGILVNGTRVAERPLSETFEIVEARTGGRYWSAPVSVLTLSVSPSSDAAVDWVVIEGATE